MKHLLSDYIFDDSLRYEGHKMVYTSPEGEECVFSGMMGAAVLATLLSITDEGETRGIAIDTPEERKDFFVRYEKEVLADNGGLFITEVQALSDAYMEINGDLHILARICRNDRLFDLAYGLVIEYMQYLVREEVREHIDDFYPYEGPFYKWLLNAGYRETYRQRLLNINWTDMAAVYAFAQELSDNPSSITSYPTFVFGLSAERVLNGYWTWLWTAVQKEAAQYPDAKQRLVDYKQTILEEETHYDDIKPEMKDFTPEQINLFRSWMNQWIDFVKHKITSPEEESFPEQHKRTRIRQELFPDKYLTCPEPDKYAATRDYLIERCRYDEVFKQFILTHTIAELCDQLSMMFGWLVVPNHLSKRFKKAQIS